MNKPAWFFGTTSVLLGGLCLVVLQREPAQSTRPATQPAPDQILQEQLTQARAERDRLETVVNSLRAAPVSAALPPPTAATANLGALPPPAAYRVDLSPSARRLSLQLHSGAIFRKLGLSGSQLESLVDVLLAQQDRAASMAGASPDPDARTRNRAEIAALIGNERAQQLEDWQSRGQARFELRRMRDQLEDSGEPLSEAQIKRISELMQAQPPAPLTPRQKDETPEAFSERFKAWRNDHREQLRNQLSSLLEPRQLERYDDMEVVSREFEKAMPMRMPPMLQATAPSAGQAAPPPSR